MSSSGGEFFYDGEVQRGVDGVRKIEIVTEEIDGSDWSETSNTI